MDNKETNHNKTKQTTFQSASSGEHAAMMYMPCEEPPPTYLVQRGDQVYNLVIAPTNLLPLTLPGFGGFYQPENFETSARHSMYKQSYLSSRLSLPVPLVSTAVFLSPFYSSMDRNEYVNALIRLHILPARLLQFLVGISQ